MNTYRDTRTLFVGGSSGMSKAAARVMLEEGGAVVLLGRRADKLEAAAKEFRPLGRIDTEAVDLTDRSAVQAFAKRVPAREHWKRVPPLHQILFLHTGIFVDISKCVKGSHMDSRDIDSSLPPH
jgi:NADP-dependent 3-hydroxy acid dehydrogenase YdfG